MLSLLHADHTAFFNYSAITPYINKQGRRKLTLVMNTYKPVYGNHDQLKRGYVHCMEISSVHLGNNTCGVRNVHDHCNRIANTVT